MDKVLHFVGCLVIALVVGYLLVALVGLIVSVLVGVIKEVYDSRSNGTSFDWRDLTASATGALAGYIIIIGV